MPRDPLALIFSLPLEFHGLRPSLEIKRSMEITGEWSGRLEDKELVLLTTGIGAERAENRVRSLLNRLKVRYALSLGFCGGLAAGLRSGDILLASEVRDEAKPEELRGSAPDLLDEARGLRPDSFRLETGRLVTVSSPVVGVDEKSTLGRTTGASAVDMETIGVARALDSAEVPYPLPRTEFARC